MKRTPLWAGGLALALLVAGLLSPLASKLPDGLDHVAESLGFAERERKKPLVAAPLSGYRLPGVRQEGASTALAGVLGTLVVFGGAFGLGFVLRHRQSSQS